MRTFRAVQARGVRPGSIRPVPQPGPDGLKQHPVMYRVGPVYGLTHMVMTTLRRARGLGSVSPCSALHGEFDPGSGRTLAACLTHASGATNQGLPWGKAANGGE